MFRIGIIGGGPGGLMTAYRLAHRRDGPYRVTLLEASGRLGGKLTTRSFDAAQVPYEAGAAEVYDYSGLGDDPLRTLVDELDLPTRPMEGQTVVFDGRVVRGDEDIARYWGAATLREIRAFRNRVAALMPAESWHPDSWPFDRAHPWAGRSCTELLDTVADPVARHYLKVAAHTDLATEPHLTNGLNGIKNFVMDIPGYVGFYAIQGGMSRLGERLAEDLGRTEVVKRARVTSIEHCSGGAWRVRHERAGGVRARMFDAIVLALPASQLGTVEYVGDPFEPAMRRHIARFDRPGHYLRVSMLFRSPFWETHLRGSWFMVDAFGGACVYDESARYDTGGFGVLGFLLAGNDALAAMNLAEQTLAEQAIRSLPRAVRTQASAELLEARVHRWCGGVSGQPGGLPAMDPAVSHRPDPDRLPGLLIVGDYLFDSTLNAVLRSADLVVELLAGTVAAHRARPTWAERWAVRSGGTSPVPAPVARAG